MTTTKAKRGDLVAITFERSDYVIGQGPSVRNYVEVHEVSSITRDGVVKCTRDLHAGARSTPIERRYGWQNRYVIGADTIDKAGALAAIKGHHYEGHPGQLRPFDSLEELRDLLRPFLIGQKVSA